MTGIDLTDTIVVRRSIDKGTKVLTETLKPLNWAGKEFKKYEKQRRSLAGHLSIASSKGTKRIPLRSLRETKIPDLTGLYLSTDRGTALRMG